MIGATLMAKKPVRKTQPGIMVRLPDELRGPLDARTAATGRSLTAELTIAVVKHLSAEPEAAPVMKLPAKLPTGSKPVV